MPNPTPLPRKPFRLGLVLFPGCMPAGLFATADMVRACNLRAGRELMQATWVGLDRRDVPTHRGPNLRAEATLDEARCDAWLLPGLWLASTDALAGALQIQQPLISALRRPTAATALWSYCAGVALVAAAGRLDGRDATATWWLQASLAERFPRARWHCTADLVTSRSAITASGPNGYLPLMLDQLSRRYPAGVLEDVQELLMLPSPRSRHPAFQAVEMIRLSDPDLRILLSWAHRTAAQEVTLAAAAERLSVSVRTLCRLVANETNMAAGEWLRMAKLSQAAEALRASRKPVKTISEQLGFGSEGGLYRAFKAATGLTPSAYRQAYGAVTSQRAVR
jgi:transcriptional regulator GlxA family with amidase domain